MFVPRIDLLTRLELFLRRRDLSPRRVAEAVVYSRQHLLRVRLGEAEPTRRFIAALTEACETLTGDIVAPGMLFERGDQLFRSQHQRLSRLFQDDLRVLDAVLHRHPFGSWARQIETANVASETAVRYLLRRGRSRIDENPCESAEILSAAAAMAASLGESASELAYSLEAHSRKAYANALRHLGEYESALAELAVAAKLFLRARFCVNEAGQVEYTRGTILLKMERWNEARLAAHHRGN